MSQVSFDSSVYSEYGINEDYDNPNNYRKRNSYYGNGKYPPDWEDRREAVWSKQKYQCARCGAYKGDVTGTAVHHIVHLADGGGNHLENLAGLCEDCHSLMHPDLDIVDGRVVRAALFPDLSARDKVAVVRWPTDDEELTTDLEYLSSTSEPKRNAWAVTEASVATSASDAKRASSALQTMLIERGYVPRTSDHYILEIKPKFNGLRGLVTRYEPPMHMTQDASASEIKDWTGLLSRKLVIRLTGDVTQAKFTFQDGNKNRVKQSASLDIYNSAERITPTLAPPPLTIRSLPSYAIDTAIFSAWTVTSRGIIPALLFTLFARGLLPFESILINFFVLLFLFGTLLTLPTVYKSME